MKQAKLAGTEINSGSGSARCAMRADRAIEGAGGFFSF
jgi:hypothetical protein